MPCKAWHNSAHVIIGVPGICVYQELEEVLIFLAAPRTSISMSSDHRNSENLQFKLYATKIKNEEAKWTLNMNSHVNSKWRYIYNYISMRIFSTNHKSVLALTSARMQIVGCGPCLANANCQAIFDMTIISQSLRKCKVSDQGLPIQLYNYIISTVTGV